MNINKELFYNEMEGWSATPNKVQSGVVKLYFPSVDRNGKPLEGIKSNKVYQNVCSEICSISGGLTVYPTSGMYINSTGKLIKDDISLISVYTDKLDKILDCMYQNAKLILSELDQESVMIEVNNQVKFIKE